MQLLYCFLYCINGGQDKQKKQQFLHYLCYFFYSVHLAGEATRQLYNSSYCVFDDYQLFVLFSLFSLHNRHF